jgi:4-amino-4-deoxy-L-arabinose transferase-like glycosyltransferase
LFIVAELCRVSAALWLEDRNRRVGVEHDFPDSELYWKLALRVAAGEPFDDGKRQVLRTPGYPVFLAGAIRLFGPSITGARHAQAAVGSLSCVLLYFLVRKLVSTRVGAMAAGVAAVFPFAVFLSATLLSEALFTFALLVQLLALARVLGDLDRSDIEARPTWWAVAVGLSGAAATLVRPSWILATPLVAVYLVIRWWIRAERRFDRFRAACAMLLMFSLGMSPWWLRNWHVTGHFVSTTLWVGASLYDGLNEHATGASNMEFMDQPERFGLQPDLKMLTEWDQDQMLRRAARRFAGEHPWRVIELAGIKFVRFWNPLPNAAEFRSLPLRLVSFATCAPVLLLALLGAWRLRRRWEVIALLAGPVLYFCAIHLVFVSSIRYREAAMLPVLGVVAASLVPITNSPTVARRASEEQKRA